MLAYHGSVVGPLTTLKPFAGPHSNLKYPCVYLSANKALASVYIWNKPYKWMTFTFREDGIPVYNESFRGGLEEFYGGVKGFLYTCEGEFETDARAGIRHAVISREPVAVAETEAVDDALEYIIRCEREGTMVVNRFEELTEEQRERDRSMVLGAIRHHKLLGGGHPLSPFVREKFPELWATAELAATEGEA